MDKTYSMFPVPRHLAVAAAAVAAAVAAVDSHLPEMCRNLENTEIVKEV
jgi:hypothetical protein